MTRAPTVESLSDQQMQFVTAYLELGSRPENGPEAAKRAGLAKSDDDAARAAAILLGSDRIARTLKAEIGQRFAAAAATAFDTIAELCRNGRSEQVRLAAAKEILDRGVGPVVSRSAVVSTNLAIEDTINLIEQASRKSEASIPALPPANFLAT